MARGQHVVPSGDKWSVRRAGASRASRVYDTQQEAIQHGQEIARKQKTDLYIYGLDGRIRERQSYASDAAPPKN